MADNVYTGLALKPYPRDKNSKPLVGAGTDVVTKRFTSVDSSTGAAISLPDDCKAIAIYVENGGTNLCSFIGNSDNSETVYITDKGFWLPAFPVAAEASTALGTLKSISGTFNVSVWGFK